MTGKGQTRSQLSQLSNLLTRSDMRRLGLLFAVLLAASTVSLVVFTALASSDVAYDPNCSVRWCSPLWDDLRFPASGINPPGAVSDPARSTTTGLLEFSGSADNIIAGVAQMPHAWQEGSAVHAHAHLRFPSSATCNTRWLLEYDVASPNGNFTNNSGVYTALTVVTQANPANVKKQQMTELGVIPMTGHVVSANIVWRLTRLANSDGADTCTAVTELLDLDFHYQTDFGGSRQEYVK